ncbi:MAG: TolC family protein [Lentimicrobium sp.]|nr:TolC family protein [Lentimicrobium sp.]
MNSRKIKTGKFAILLISTAMVVLMPHLSAKAQQLSPGQAVQIALEQNYNIRLARLTEEEIRNNLSYGNAGFLPGLTAGATQSNSITNSRQEYLSGQINEREGAKSNTFSSNLSLNWTIFDGFRMFNQYSLLSKQLAAGELSTRVQVENTITAVLGGYYNIVQLKNRARVYEKAVQLGEERVQIARDMQVIGSGSGLEVLQAEVDFNTDRSQLLDLQKRIAEAEIALNLLLARDPAALFSVEDTIALMPPFDYEQLRNKMDAGNAALQISEMETEMAMNRLKDIQGRRWPVVGVNLGYNFNVQSSQSGFVIDGRTSGVNYGVTASMSIFDGFNVNRQQKNARIGLESARLQLESHKSELEALLLSTHKAYQARLQMLALEKSNRVTAEVNFDVASERFRLGELSGLEYREAQKNLLQADERLISAGYEVRLLEIALLQISGAVLLE